MDDPLSSGRPNTGCHAYICHSSADKELARLFAKSLGDYGYKTWCDESELKAGEDFPTSIQGGLSNSELCVVLLSHAAESSREASREWAAIQEKVWERPQMQVIPVLVEDVETPPFLRKWKSARLGRPASGLNDAVQQVVRQIVEQQHADRTPMSLRDDPSSSTRYDEMVRTIHGIGDSAHRPDVKG